MAWIIFFLINGDVFAFVINNDNTFVCVIITKQWLYSYCDYTTNDDIFYCDYISGNTFLHAYLPQ